MACLTRDAEEIVDTSTGHLYVAAARLLTRDLATH
jgi:hypothetical protein